MPSGLSWAIKAIETCLLAHLLVEVEHLGEGFAGGRSVDGSRYIALVGTVYEQTSERSFAACDNEHGSRFELVLGAKHMKLEKKSSREVIRNMIMIPGLCSNTTTSHPPNNVLGNYEDCLSAPERE